MKKLLTLLVAASLVAVVAAPAAIIHESNAAASPLAGVSDIVGALAGGARFVPGQVLVGYEPGASEGARVDALNAVGALLVERVETGAMRDAGEEGLALLSLQSGLSVLDAVGLLRGNSAIRFAEPNWIYTHTATSNDPYYTNGSLYGMYGDASAPANQFGSQAAEAWAAGHTGSNSVYVGVIDEGVQFDHADLAGNVWTNPFDPVDGVDNDGNGYADDTHGWDFFQDNNSVYDGTRPSDYTTDSHGTHVAGTIGAPMNGIGVVGVNWNVTIISGKFLGPDGGGIADAIAAVNYFVDLKTRHGLNLVALNNSWGGGGYSQAMHDAVIRAAKADILFTAASGNGNLAGIGQNNDTKPSYPSNYNTTQGTSTETAAAYDAVIAVAALTKTGALARYSNYGKTTVDIGAPGSGVWSTTPNNTLSSFDGTSMATPHVTGGIALYASTHPGATPQQIRSAIIDTAVTTSSLVNKTVTGKRLNVSSF